MAFVFQSEKFKVEKNKPMAFLDIKKKTKIKENFKAFNSSTKKTLNLIKEKSEKEINNDENLFLQRKNEFLNLKHDKLKNEFLKKKQKKFQKFLKEDRFKYKKNTSLGPGKYFNDSKKNNIKIIKLKKSKTTKNIFKNKKKKKIQNNLPEIGPCSYNTKRGLIGNNNVKNIIEWVKESKRTISLSILEYNKIGPGAYNISKDISKRKIFQNPRLINFIKKGFNSKKKIEKNGDKEYNKNPVPGPGYYKLKGTFNSELKKKKFEFFNSCVERFNNKELLYDNGPGKYFKDFKNKNTNFNSKKGNLGFSSFQERFKKDSDSEIGPGTYEISKNLIHETFNKKSNFFKKSLKLNTTNNLIEDNKIIKKFENNSKDDRKKTFKHQIVIKKKNIPFLSKDKRKFNFNSNIIIPGPGDYNLDLKNLANKKFKNSIKRCEKVFKSIKKNKYKFEPEFINEIFNDLPGFRDDMKDSIKENKVPFHSNSQRFKNINKDKTELSEFYNQKSKWIKPTFNKKFKVTKKKKKRKLK